MTTQSPAGDPAPRPVDRPQDYYLVQAACDWAESILLRTREVAS